MRDILQSYSPDKNFWEENPQFTTIQPFRGFWKSDRTKGKLHSSNVMWAIALIYHPKSDVYNVDNKEENILPTVLDIKEKDVEVFLEDKKVLIEAFIDAALSQAQKSLVAWNGRLKSRDGFLANQEYTFGYEKEIDGVVYNFKDNTKPLDDMAAKTARLYEEYFKINKELNEEESISRNKKIDSATATGDI